MGPIAQKLPKKENSHHKVTEHLIKALQAATQKPVQKMAGGGEPDYGGSMSQIGQNASNNAIPNSPGQANFQGSSGLSNSAVNPNTGLIGSINGALGLNNNFVAQGANLTPGTNAGQLNQAYNQAQAGIGAQQNLVNALQAQNGIGNQSNVFNQMQGVANGQGPNPAQAMLHQQTQANVANQAALMAGQRGANSNVGLIARQAAQQGAATQQQAIGQGAALQAQQSLGALGNMGDIAQNQVNQYGQAVTGYNTAVQNEQNSLQGANNAYNNALVGMQSNINNNNAAVSMGNQSAATGMFGGLMQGASSMGGLFADGGEVEDDTKPQQQETAPIAQPVVQPQPEVSANLGATAYTPQAASSAPNPGASPGALDVGASLKDAFGGGGKGGGGGGGGGGMMSLMALLSNGGQVSANMGGANYANQATSSAANIGSSPMAFDVGKSLIPTKKKKEDEPTDKAPEAAPEATMEAQGGKIDYRSGGHVAAQNPRQKAKVAGNSYANDKVPALLSEGEFVLDRETLNDNGPLGEAARNLVSQIKNKKASGGKYAQGGGVQKYAEGTKDGPIETDESQQEINRSDELANTAMDQAAQSNGNAAPTSQGMPATPAGNLGSNPDYQKSYQDYYNEHAQELGQANARFDQHLANGEIQPETLKSLYAKKDTTGKIATIFGLMAGGMGSAFTHQPNALLSIMQNQIQNDLDAQKTSVNNAQNFIKLNQAAEKNKADMGLTNTQTAQGIQAKAYAQMAQDQFAQLAKRVGSMPDGPQKQMSQQVLGWLWQQNAQKIMNMNAQAAGAEAFLKSTGGIGGGSGGGNKGPVNYNKMNQLDRRAKMGDPTISATDIGNMTQEATKIEPIRNFRNNFNNAFQELNSPDAGKLSPHRRESLINSLAGDYSKITGYGADAAHQKMESLLPKLGDWSRTTQEEKLRNNNTMFDTLEAGVPTLKRFGVLNQNKAPSVQEKSNSSSPKEGQQQTSKSGRPIIYKNGKWMYK